MAGHEPFPDVELALQEYLTNPDRKVVTVVPVNYRDAMAGGKFLVRVNRAGGAESDSKTTDNPRVSVQVYAVRNAATPRAPQDEAAKIRAEILNLPAITAAGRLDSGRTESGPTEIPFGDSEVVLIQQTFRLSTRR